MTAASCASLVQSRSERRDAAVICYVLVVRLVLVGLMLEVEGHRVSHIALSLPLAVLGSACTVGLLQPKLVFSFLGHPAVTGPVLGQSGRAGIPRAHIHRLPELALRLQRIVIVTMLVSGVIMCFMCVGIRTALLAPVTLVTVSLFVSASRAGVLALVAAHRMQLKLVARGAAPAKAREGRAPLRRQSTRRLVVSGEDNSSDEDEGRARPHAPPPGPARGALPSVARAEVPSAEEEGPVPLRPILRQPSFLERKKARRAEGEALRRRAGGEESSSDESDGGGAAPAGAEADGEGRESRPSARVSPLTPGPGAVLGEGHVGRIPSSLTEAAPRGARP